MNRRRTKLFLVHFSATLLLAMVLNFNSCDKVRFSTDAGGEGNGGGGGDLCVSGSEASCILVCPQGSVAQGASCVIVSHNVDNYTIKPLSPKKDYFLVIDNSGSMAVDNRALAARLNGFVDLLVGAGIDWQMCYTTTDLGDENVARFWKTKNNRGDVIDSPNRVLSAALQSATFNIEDSFNLSVGQFNGGGSGNEAGVIAAENAVSHASNQGCFRDNSDITFILISDEDEKSCGGRCKTASDENPYPNRELSNYTNQYRQLALEDSPDYAINFVKAKFPESSFVFHSIVIRSKPNRDVACYNTQDSTNPAFYGMTYESLSSKTGGVTGDICSNDYSKELEDIFMRDKEILASVTLKCTPSGGAAPQVSISPMASGQMYELRGNKVTFNPPLAEGTMVKVDYYCSQTVPPIKTM